MQDLKKLRYGETLFFIIAKGDKIVVKEEERNLFIVQAILNMIDRIY
jgi:hypothetical protein